ncbi:MAG: DUF2268 domain-containing putative Zn-dependent protease [Vicinamibacterales bacterium]
MNRALACLALLIAVAACRETTEGIRIQFVGSYAFSSTERRTIARIAGAAARDARKHLSALASEITLQVGSGTDVIPELGATAAASAPAFVTWTVDPNRPEGVVKIAESYLRQALFHEFHHLLRGTAYSGSGLMDSVITEGTATAFERDFAGAKVPWGEYPEDVSMWVDELLKQTADAKRSDWIFRHPEGRRWIGMRAGTYLVDRAMKQLNRTSADLVAMPTPDILAAANAGR